MKTHQEIMAITSLVMRINELKGDQTLHLDIFPQGITFTAFDCNAKIESQQAIYSCEAAYLPRLRKLRHDLENIGQEALVQRQEAAA